MSGPHPAVAAARVAVREALAAWQLTELTQGEGMVVVACSGGPDSLALAAATAFVAPRMGVRAGACIVDHGLQPQSDAVARRALSQCLSLGLAPAEVVRVEVGKDGGPEAAARTARRQGLEQCAARHGATGILLGHTLDDQAETVLLRLARGSGAKSLAGMAPRDGLWLRPFLSLRRWQTEQVCQAQGLQPWHDPTNDPAPGDRSAPLRSQLRAHAMPVLREVLGDGLDAALARTAELLRDDDEALQHLALQLLREASQTDGLSCAVLRQAPAGLRRRALKEAMHRAGVPRGQATWAHVEATDALVTRYHGQGPASLPGGIAAQRKYGTLSFLAARVGPHTVKE